MVQLDMVGRTIFNLKVLKVYYFLCVITNLTGSQFT